MADSPPRHYLPPEVLAESITATGTGKSPLARLLGNLDQRAFKVIDWPGNVHEPDPDEPNRSRPVRVALWALTDQEGRGCLERALAFYEKAKIPREVADKAGLITAELRVQTLAIALRHPDSPIAPFAADPNDVRRMTPDLQDALHNEYIQWLDERSPLRKIDPRSIDANLEALMVALGKGVPPDALLSFYDTGTLRLSLARSLHLLIAATRPSYLDSSSASDGVTRASEPLEPPDTATDSPSPSGPGASSPPSADDPAEDADAPVSLRTE